jgi:hypothetical protein
MCQKDASGDPGYTCGRMFIGYPENNVGCGDDDPDSGLTKFAVGF